MNDKKYIELEDLEVYQIARKMSDIAWSVFTNLPKQMQFSIGDQFVRATDSIGANIAEGYGGYSYLDRVRILYIARGSFFEERKHWLTLLKHRNLIDPIHHSDYCQTGDKFELKLNIWIKSLKNLKNNS